MKPKRRQLLQLTAAAAAAPVLGGCAGDHEISPDQRYPIGPFGPDSTAEEVTEGLDLSGRIALVTGCNSGLGYETMRVLAKRGAHVIGTGRTIEKAVGACGSVEGTTTPLMLDLADFQTAISCSAAVQMMGLTPDILICNAGINTFGDLELIDGLEKHFVVNFLGHFVLVDRLLPGMIAKGSGRIVHVGSQSAYLREPAEGIDFNNLRGEGEFDPVEAYGSSKLANILFSLELARRLEGTGVTSNAVHPGLVQTNITRTAPSLLRRAFDLLGGFIAKTPEQGAATQVYVATSPRLEGVSGAYFEDCNPVEVSGDHHLLDRAMALRLWNLARELTGDYLMSADDPGSVRSPLHPTRA
jgi:NAD(P)-dependent dehydrogenase (short-subunit alcohol dehydrogenase family)